MSYMPSEHRYERMSYHRCGRSGLKLPAISLGLWQNFGENANPDNARAICRTAFDHGITHFDLANNYGRRRAVPRSCSAAFSSEISPVIEMNW